MASSLSGKHSGTVYVMKLISGPREPRNGFSTGPTRRRQSSWTRNEPTSSRSPASCFRRGIPSIRPSGSHLELSTMVEYLYSILQSGNDARGRVRGFQESRLRYDEIQVVCQESVQGEEKDVDCNEVSNLRDCFRHGHGRGHGSFVPSYLGPFTGSLNGLVHCRFDWYRLVSPRRRRNHR
jgi:hypothetical protein